MSENEQDPGPTFQAFTVKTTTRAAQQKVDRAIRDVLGDGWRAENYGDRKNQFEVTAEEGALTARDAWDRTYQLRAHKGIASAEPLFKAWVTDRPEWASTATSNRPPPSVYRALAVAAARISPKPRRMSGASNWQESPRPGRTTSPAPSREKEWYRPPGHRLPAAPRDRGQRADRHRPRPLPKR